jgi:hypothetical protein
MKLGLSRQLVEKYSSIKFHENLSSGSRGVPCGQRDRIFAFRKRLKIYPTDIDYRVEDLIQLVQDGVMLQSFVQQATDSSASFLDRLGDWKVFIRNYAP